jgi:hypothetical protein
VSAATPIISRVRRTRIGRLTGLVLISALILGFAACSSSQQSPPAATDWSAAPVTGQDGLRSLAVSTADGFALHTASGDKAFIPGMNLGSTTPTHQPGELAVTAEDYRRWFVQMGDLGIRAVRIYTIHPPAFYTELLSYNQTHPTSPLYLVHGVYIPDEGYIKNNGTLYDKVTDEGFSAELADASNAVRGRLDRAPQPGRSSGRWRADVSPWLMSWIIGVEWDPVATKRTNTVNADAPGVNGRYFTSTADASSTERWIAKHMDELATLEAGQNQSVPIAFANWPTVDPLTHPDEPLQSEDLVGVDANHVQPTKAWPGGTFASYHAYPYYPDFLRHETALAQTTWNGRADPYAGYLQALKAHHAPTPVMVTEVGVPSSLGSAHRGTNGRDQGGHSELAAIQVDADLMRLIKDQGLAGAFLFSWTDEWFKLTWNTMEHQLPADRRQLWHDALTNEQYFGVIATDPGKVPDAASETSPPTGPLAYLLVDADASYLHIDATLRRPEAGMVSIDVDTLPGGGADYRVELDLTAGTGQVFVRRELDPVRLDVPARDYAAPEQAWLPYRLITNRALVVEGQNLEPEFQDVGALLSGDWDSTSPSYNSLATWRIVDHSDQRTVRLRLPWALLGLADPSSRTALGTGVPAEPVGIDELRLRFSSDGQTFDTSYSWPTWNHIGYTERPKPGQHLLRDAYQDLAP